MRWIVKYLQQRQSLIVNGMTSIGELYITKHKYGMGGIGVTVLVYTWLSHPD